jgi:ubiquinone/menaquinone biosynthesis C-methylase UbiE
MNEDQSKENTYVMDPESGAEMARLIDQDHFLNEAMEDLFPASVNLAEVHHVLDVACGPGGWAQEVAFTYPDITVVGIDVSKAMIAFANMRARVRRLRNASFQIMNVRAPLAFPDESFDLVNARFMLSFLPRDEWPGVIKEFARITRAGGTIVLTEFDTYGENANSQAFQELGRYGYEAMYRAGLYAGSGTGVTSRLEHFLQEAGCHDIQQQWHCLDFSAGAPAHQTIYHNLTLGMKLAQPFLLKMGVATQERIEELHEQMLVDMLSDDFHATWEFLTVWGSKP